MKELAALLADARQELATLSDQMDAHNLAFADSVFELSELLDAIAKSYDKSDSTKLTEDD